jgi:hypothetical protein
MYPSATGLERFGRRAAARFGSTLRDAISALAECGAQACGTQQKSLFELARVQMNITTSSVRRVSKDKQENFRDAASAIH